MTRSERELIELLRFAGEPEVFEVSGEMIPLYSARRPE